MTKKYKLLENDTIIFSGKKLYRIQAIKDFAFVKAGYLGGYIEKEENLSHTGNCWVSDNAKVFDNSRVRDDAEVGNNACVCDNAHVSGRAEICHNAKVRGIARIDGRTEICGNAIIYDNDDYFVFKDTWTGGYFTYTRSNKMWKVQCFYGTGDELIKQAYADNEKSGKYYELYVNLVREIEKLEIED